jgi:hypothetical protein
MGNRAVIAMENIERKSEDCQGIYLHWNGGKDSVDGFLKYAKDMGFRGGDYGMARLTQVICNYFGGVLSCGIDSIKYLDCDNHDNGVYWINDKFDIVKREFARYPEQEAYDLDSFVEEIKLQQPTKKE